MTRGLFARLHKCLLQKGEGSQGLCDYITDLRTLSVSADSQCRAKGGQQMLEVVMERTERSCRGMEATDAFLQELGRSSSLVEKIVGAVQNIADQTKILSLNASIEAAKACEHGRRLAVGAEEVSRLAEDTNNTVLRIGELTQHSASLMQHVAEEIRKVQDLTHNGTYQSDESSATMEIS